MTDFQDVLIVPRFNKILYCELEYNVDLLTYIQFFASDKNNSTIWLLALKDFPRTIYEGVDIILYEDNIEIVQGAIVNIHEYINMQFVFIEKDNENE